MEAVGIIAEYNPFHNGHLYQLTKIKEKYPNDIIVLVLSGNFTQRGEPSIIDKWQKKEIALQAGCDLIIELPFPFATQSADYFSYGAITILEYLHVKKVIFGTECNDLNALEEIVEAELHHPDFNPLVQMYLKFGNNYPTALSFALKDLTQKEVTSSPNDLLAISYIKTIKKNHYHIIPETIKRTNSYHSEKLEGEISSAKAIRKALQTKNNITSQVPAYVLPYLKNLHFLENYFPLLKYKLLTEKDLSIYQGVEEGIENKLKQEIKHCSTYEELISKIKSKRYTHNKISRMLLHILCGFTKEKAKQMNEIRYIRILGMNEKGKKYLNQIKKEVCVPIISKISKEKDLMLDFEISTTSIYALPNKEDSTLLEKEYKNKLYKEE